MPKNGSSLKEIIDRFFVAWQNKVKVQQGGVFTFRDHSINNAWLLYWNNKNEIPWEQGIEAIKAAFDQFVPREELEPFLAHVINWNAGRYVAFEDRLGTDSSETDAFIHASEVQSSFNMSQGKFSCVKWKDTLLFKTAYDIAIYEMLFWELKPKTIIEIGSASGGGAIWMADLSKVLDFDCKVLSMDLEPPALQNDRVVFLKGDSNLIGETFSMDMMQELPHPWLIIEDAHVNVKGVLENFDPCLVSGDYLIVEDSNEKVEDLSAFLAGKERYKVDSYYCDFFGQNVTCSPNSIFKFL